VSSFYFYMVFARVQWVNECKILKKLGNGRKFSLNVSYYYYYVPEFSSSKKEKVSCQCHSLNTDKYAHSKEYRNKQLK
jgi:hypothetical protein